MTLRSIFIFFTNNFYHVSLKRIDHSYNRYSLYCTQNIINVYSFDAVRDGTRGGDEAEENKKH